MTDPNCPKHSADSSFCQWNMILSDIAAGEDCGVALLDPYASTYLRTLHYLAHAAPDLAERVVLFDPDTTDLVSGSNSDVFPSPRPFPVEESSR